MDRFLMFLYDAPELIDFLLGRIVDYYHEVSRRIFEAARGAIDIFFIGNDFGTQNGPVVSPALFRRFFLPFPPQSFIYNKVCVKKLHR
jgi:uroporphyrinogen decarboxylase